MRHLLLCLMLCTALLLAPARSWACWCSIPPADEEYRNAVAVFTAKIMDAPKNTTGCALPKKLTRVGQVYKGKPAEEVYVQSGDGCVDCGVNLKKGVKYLIYATSLTNGVYTIRACQGAYPLSNKRTNAYLPTLEERRKQVDALGDLIAQNPEQERYLLKTMAEHEVYWQDYVNAEDSLRRLIALNREDEWAMVQLINALYKQGKAREINDLYESRKEYIGKFRQHKDVAPALSYAIFQMNLETEEWVDYKFEEARLKDKNLANRKFKSMSFKDSSLENVDFSSSEWKYATWTKSQVTKSSFSHAYFESAVFDDTNFIEANFGSSRLEGMTAKDSRFRYSDFSGANLKKAQIKNSDFYHSSFTGADLTGAKIKDAIFAKADISGANFEGASLEGIDWTDVMYDCKTKGTPLPPKACPSAP